MESPARIIDAEVDLATGIVIERVAEEPSPRRRRRARALMLVAALAGVGTGLAVSRIPSTGPGGSRSAEVVGTGVQVANLRSDAGPCRRTSADVLVCGVSPEGGDVGALHE
jgi:hypothetical protein